jgi:two-component system, chemotaxis family, sensor kinase CheA
MPARADLRARLMATFKVEAEEHLQAIGGHLLALERGLPPDQLGETVEAAFRAVHTLKGAARSVGLTEMERRCQAVESLFSRAKKGELPLTHEVLQQLREAAQALDRLLGEAAAADAGGPRPHPDRGAASDLPDLHPDRGTPSDVPAPADASSTGGGEPRRPAPHRASAPAAPPAPAAAATIRLDTASLDALLLRAEDLLVPKLALAQRVREARALAAALAGCLAHGLGPGGRHGLPAAMAESGEIAEIAQIRSAAAQGRSLLRGLMEDERATGAAIDALQADARQLRMMPASTVLERLPGMVAEVALAGGKSVEWSSSGAEIAVDRRVLEALRDPLLHLVRNAVDHGVEPPETRAAAGKPPRGRIAVTIAALEARRIEVRVEDDGAGIDLGKLCEAAVRLRAIRAEDAAALADEAALELVFRSGVSTSPVITELSGHGLGMAIARESVERLGGRVEVATRRGLGTTVRMVLPATIATSRGVLVRAGGQLFLLPLAAVERAARVAPREVESVEGRASIRVEGRAVSLASLARLLGRPPERAATAETGAAGAAAAAAAKGSESRQPCVIVAAGDVRAALLVDEILGDREVLVKELRPPLVRMRHVAAAGLLGGGELALILRPADLLRAIGEPLPAVGSEPAAAATAGVDAGRPLSVLVVDDSITTRTMEKNLLEAAGYRVQVAADGQEAWTTLRHERFDLVLADVDMPRMDGFALTARIRADPGLADLPLVLVTALESRQDKERGIEVGANAYVIKSSFDQSKLLEIIGRLV